MSNFQLELDYYLQAYRLHQGLSKSSNAEARRLLRKSIGLAVDAERNIPRAYGLLSFTIQTGWLSNWITQPQANELRTDAIADLQAIGNPGADALAELMELNADDPIDTIVKRVIRAYAVVAKNLDDQDYDNRWSLGTANLYSNHYSDAFSEYQEAISLVGGSDTPAVCVASLNVDYADALFFIGNESLSDEPGDYQSAIEGAISRTMQAIADNPNDPKHFRWNWTLGWAYYELAAYNEPGKNYALSLATLQQLRNPHLLILKNLIASYIGNGMTQAARNLASELLKIDPQYNVAVEDRWPYRDPQRRERFKDHLRAADLPG
jgi:tetratricopeptide (TPR) repeat protein